MGKPYKFMVRCDMEGVSGIVSYEQAEPGKSEYEEGRRLFHCDLLALLAGLQEGGAGEIYIYDEHYYGRNIDLTRLPASVCVYAGKPPYTADWAGGIDESFDALILLGFHSMSETTGALLNHTYEPDLRGLILNGVRVGEIGMEAAVAGSFGVPLALITADSAGVREAHSIVPEALAVTVKESLSEFGALCYPEAVTSAAIRQAAVLLAAGPIPGTPYRLRAPCRLEIEFFDTPFSRLYRAMYGEEAILAADAARVWAEYRRRKEAVDSALAAAGK